MLWNLHSRRFKTPGTVFKTIQVCAHSVESSPCFTLSWKLNAPVPLDLNHLILPASSSIVKPVKFHYQIPAHQSYIVLSHPVQCHGQIPACLVQSVVSSHPIQYHSQIPSCPTPSYLSI